MTTTQITGRVMDAEEKKVMKVFDGTKKKKHRKKLREIFSDNESLNLYIPNTKDKTDYNKNKVKTAARDGNSSECSGNSSAGHALASSPFRRRKRMYRSPPVISLKQSGFNDNIHETPQRDNDKLPADFANEDKNSIVFDYLEKVLHKEKKDRSRTKGIKTYDNPRMDQQSHKVKLHRSKVNRGNNEEDDLISQSSVIETFVKLYNKIIGHARKKSMTTIIREDNSDIDDAHAHYNMTVKRNYDDKCRRNGRYVAHQHCCDNDEPRRCDKLTPRDVMSDVSVDYRGLRRHKHRRRRAPKCDTCVCTKYKCSNANRLASSSSAGEDTCCEEVVECCTDEFCADKKKKNCKINTKIQREVEEQRQSVEKMMQMWQDVIGKFNEITSAVGKENEVKSAVGARDNAEAQLMLWRECMKRYESMSRDYGEPDAIGYKDVSRHRSELEDMTSMWRECNMRHRETQRELANLKKQLDLQECMKPLYMPQQPQPPQPALELGNSSCNALPYRMPSMMAPYQSPPCYDSAPQLRQWWWNTTPPTVPVPPPPARPPPPPTVRGRSHSRGSDEEDKRRSRHRGDSRKCSRSKHRRR